MGVVVPALEVLVRADHVVHVGAHVRLDDRGRDLGVVRHAHGLADVVQQRREHHLVVGAGPLGERRGLQRVRELVDREAVGDLGERPQHAEHAVGDAALVLGRSPCR